MPSRIACSCPDWRFHGDDLSRERMEAKAKLAENVMVELIEERHGFIARTTQTETHHVTLAPDGDLGRLCKHCIAVLWHEGVPLYLVEYVEPVCEVRAEAFWGDELAVKAIMSDGEVLTVTKLERRNDEN